MSFCRAAIFVTIAVLFGPRVAEADIVADRLAAIKANCGIVMPQGKGWNSENLAPKDKAVELYRVASAPKDSLINN
jgi:hypothetical protein